MDVEATVQLLKESFPPAPVPPPKAICSFCRATGKMKCCGVCKASYCGEECQRVAWPTHKLTCKPRDAAPSAAPAAAPAAEGTDVREAVHAEFMSRFFPDMSAEERRNARAAVGLTGDMPARPPPYAVEAGWWDAHRRAEDGSVHFGRLELMTWRCMDEDCGEELGFGGFVASEEEETRRRFEQKYGGDEARYFAYRPSGFRWTCCGVPADIGNYGCDHHGDPRATRPCSCDFCRAGRPLSDRIWRKKLASQAARGLERTLCRGRSGPSTPGGDMNFAMRAMFHPTE